MAKIYPLYPFPVADSLGAKDSTIITILDHETATTGQSITPDAQSGSDALISKEKLREPIMETNYQEKYMDARLAHIDDNLKEIRTDFREIRGDIKSQKRWIVGTGVGLAALFIAIVSYFTWTMQNQFNHHISSTQSQMQAFSEYVKAVTQPQIPKTPQK